MMSFWDTMTLVQVFIAVSYQGYKNKQQVHPFPFWQFSAMQM